MRRYSVVFLIIVLIATVLNNLVGIAPNAGEIAKIIFSIFAIMAIASFTASVFRKNQRPVIPFPLCLASL